MNRLKEFRVGLGLSQEKIAREIGVSLSMYEKVERGNVPTSRGFMEKLKVRYPDINIDYIFFGFDSNIIAENECPRLAQ